MRFKRRVGTVWYLLERNRTRNIPEFCAVRCSGWYVQDETLLYPNLPCSAVLKPKVYKVVIIHNVYGSSLR